MPWTCHEPVLSGALSDWKCHESAVTWLSQQFHGTFMAGSWYFHGKVPWICHESAWACERKCRKNEADVVNYDILSLRKMPWKCHESAKPRWNLQYMSDSWQVHRGFMPLSFSRKKSKSCQTHVTFMVVSWRFHIQAWPGYSLPKFIEEMIQKVGFSCRFDFWSDFSLIFGNMSDSCRFHGSFMALSSFWFLLFFPEKIHINNWIHLKNDRLASMSDSSQSHRGFMALSCQLHSYVGFITDSCHFHGTAMKLFGALFGWKLDLYGTFFQTLKLSGTFMADSLANPNTPKGKSVRKVPWKWYENAMNMIQWLWQLFMADSWHFQPNRVPNSAGSWHVHGTFP